MADDKPRNIQGVELLNGLGIDSSGNLYWKDQKLKVERPLRLSAWQTVSAVLLVVAACVQAISAAWDAFFKP